MKRKLIRFSFWALAIAALFAVTIGPLACVDHSKPPVVVKDTIRKDTIGMLNGLWVCGTETPEDVETLRRGVRQPDILQGVAARNLQWSNGYIIRVKMDADGTQIQKDSTKRACDLLSSIANINFVFVDAPPYDIWVAYKNAGAWSQIGTSSRSAATSGPSMNLAPWTVTQRGAIVHEFCHALSLLHEQQHPNGVCLDTLKTLAYYRRTQGWSDPQIYWNVITKHNVNDVIMTQYDRNSDMHYPVPASITCDGVGVAGGTALTGGDIAILKQLYPGRGGPVNPPTTGNITLTPAQAADLRAAALTAQTAANTAKTAGDANVTKIKAILGN